MYGHLLHLVPPIAVCGVQGAIVAAIVRLSNIATAYVHTLPVGSGASFYGMFQLTKTPSNGAIRRECCTEAPPLNASDVQMCL